MRTPRIFIDASLVSGETVPVPRDKAHHLTHVLRMHAGDSIKLFNNTDFEYDAIITRLTKKEAEVEIKNSYQLDNESLLKITLYLAVTKGQHMDYSVQKSVELGVSTIVPVMSEFSNVKLRQDRLENKMSHWRNIIISAAEQCGRTRLPELNAPVLFEKCLAINKSVTRLILQPDSQQSMSDIKLTTNELGIMIGPEGGFSEHEVSEAVNNETIAVSMGPRILRAETAVVSALSNAQQLWGDLK